MKKTYAPHTVTHGIVSRDAFQKEVQKRLERIGSEFSKGFEVIHRHPKSVSFFGSARFTETHPFYQKARDLGYRISKELGYAVTTGGGPGIMEAGNKGAYEAGGESIGFTIELPHEQGRNQYVTHWSDFHYFFSRKMMLSFASEAHVFFPGGFGTLDEFFGIITLIQTGKVPTVPIILIGHEFWGAFDYVFKELLDKTYKTINSTDRKLYFITENNDEVLDIIKRAPLRDK